MGVGRDSGIFGFVRLTGVERHAVAVAVTDGVSADTA
jgi:hypothetical protein